MCECVFHSYTSFSWMYHFKIQNAYHIDHLESNESFSTVSIVENLIVMNYWYFSKKSLMRIIRNNLYILMHFTIVLLKACFWPSNIFCISLFSLGNLYLSGCVKLYCRNKNDLSKKKKELGYLWSDFKTGIYP